MAVTTVASAFFLNLEGSKARCGHAMATAGEAGESLSCWSRAGQGFFLPLAGDADRSRPERCSLCRAPMKRGADPGRELVRYVDWGGTLGKR